MDVFLPKTGIVCPISKELMIVPVRLDPCGHILDRHVIEMDECMNCPICDVTLVGYLRSSETEYKVDEFVREWMSMKALPRSMPLINSEILTDLADIYGKGGAAKVYLARNKPYTFVTERGLSNWGWLRYVVDKIFFVFCFVSAVALCYTV